MHVLVWFSLNVCAINWFEVELDSWWEMDLKIELDPLLWLSCAEELDLFTHNISFAPIQVHSCVLFFTIKSEVSGSWVSCGSYYRLLSAPCAPTNKLIRWLGVCFSTAMADDSSSPISYIQLVHSHSIMLCSTVFLALHFCMHAEEGRNCIPRLYLQILAS